MLTQAKTETPTGATKENIAHASRSLTEIIDHYKAIAIKLSLFADAIPETPSAQKEMMEEETQLLDEQASLLETALTRPIRDLEDSKAVLTLWHHEVIQSRSNSSLSVADELVNSVFEYLKKA